MSNKELNLSILDRLYREIYRRIDGWHLPEGEYTCGQIDEYAREQIGKRQGAFIKGRSKDFNINRAYRFLCGDVDWHDSIEEIKAKEIHIQVAGFRCSFFEYELVPITMKFESMCNLKSAKRERFYKESIIQTINKYEEKDYQTALCAMG